MVVEDKSHLTLREKYTEEENKKGETPLSNNQKSTMSKKKNNIYPHYWGFEICTVLKSRKVEDGLHLSSTSIPKFRL